MSGPLSLRGLSNLWHPAKLEELVDEEQFFEADAIGGVEDAPNPAVAEVRSKQVPEDDLPAEYLERLGSEKISSSFRSPAVASTWLPVP